MFLATTVGTPPAPQSGAPAPRAAAGTTDAATAPRPPRARAASESPAEAPADAPTPAADVGTVTGRVLGPDGAPAAGAKVRIGASIEDPARRTVVCAADGAFRDDAVPAGRRVLAVAGGGWATRLDVPGTEATVVDVTAGAATTVELRATRLATVTGVVLDADGRPVEGAKLSLQTRAFLYAQETCWELPATSAADGRFTIENATPGDTGFLSADAEGRPRVRVRVPPIAAGATAEVEVRFAKGVRVEVVLVDAETGAPVTKGFVYALDASTGDILGEDPLRPDGSGRIVFAARGPVNFQVCGEGYAAMYAKHVDVAAEPGPVTFRLVRARAIAGRVLRADGRPAVGAWLEAHAPSRDPKAFLMLDQVGQSAHADADGRFRIEGLPPGTWAITMVASGEQVVLGTAEAGAEDVTLRIPADVRLQTRAHIVVVGPGGAAIAQVRNRELCHQEGDVCSMAGGVLDDPDVETSIDRRATPVFEVWDARDAAGRRLPFGHAWREVPEEVPDPWTIEMPPERTVAGRVVGPDGAGIAAATVSIEVFVAGFESNEDPDLRDLGSDVAAADGTFVAHGLGDEACVLTASAPGFVPAKVRAHAGDTGVTIRLAPETPCTLTVLGPDGKPFGGAMVWLRTAEGGEFEIRGADMIPQTDASGRIRLSGLVPGRRYRLSVRVHRERPDLFDVDDDAWEPTPEATVRLERAFAVAGVVRGPDGRPFAGAVVTATDDGGAVVGSAAAGGGRFRVGDLRAGTPVRLRATAGRAASAEVAAERGAEDVVLAIDPGAWFAVRFEDGAPEAERHGAFDGVPVHVLPDVPEPGAAPEIAGGRAVVVGGLDARTRYTVIVGPSRYGLCAVVEDVLPDGRTVAVRLEPGAATGGTVAFPPGVAPARARVVALRGGVQIAEAHVFAEAGGRFGFGGLPAGRYVLRLVAEGPSLGGEVEASAGDKDVVLAAKAR